MGEKSQQRSMLQFGMEAGLYMGLYFVVKFAFTVLSLNYPALNFVAVVMMLLIPVVVYVMMYRYATRNEEKSYFSQLWMTGIFIFFFASIIGSLAQYIYYVYINPDYIKMQFEAAVSLLETLEWNGDASSFDLVKENLSQGNVPAPMTMVIQQVWVNLFFGSLLSAVMAWITTLRLKLNANNKK